MLNITQRHEQAGPDELLSVSKAAALCGLSVSSIRDYARDGRLPSVRTPGNHRRFRRSDVEQLIQQAS